MWANCRSQRLVIAMAGFYRYLFGMNERINQILEEALALDHDERSALMVTLLDNLDTDSPASVANAWADEIRKHKLELESGFV